MTGFTKNFVVKNGLTTGNITLDADSGNISGTNLSVTGISNLGAIANVIITGGSSGQAIVTDGNGNLSFANASSTSSPAPMPTYVAVGDDLTIAANYQGLFGYPITIDGTMTVDGILIDVNDNGNGGGGGGTATALDANIANVSISGGTSGYYLQTDGAGTLSWAAGGGGGSGSPGGVNTQVQFNDAGTFGGNTGFTFNKTTGTLTATYLSGAGNALSNIQGANVSGAVGLATYATTANSVAGGNVSGAVGLATYATTANSVAGANVSGTVANATYATTSGTSGTVTTAAQPNITSTGTLTSATVSGNVTANNLSTTNKVTAGNGLQVTTGALTVLSGNLDVTGNINVTGNLNYSNVTDLIVGDPLIYVGANNTGDTVDLGIVASYNNGTYYHTGIARNASTDYWTFFDGVVAEPTTVIDWANASYPTVKLGNLLATGTVSATGNGTFGNVTGGNLVTANYIYGTLTTAAQPNITSIGTLSSLSVTGNVTANSITTSGGGSGGNISGANVITATTLYAYGNVTASNANLGNLATANYFSGDGSLLTGITAATAGTVTTNAQPNITSTGTLSSLSVTGNIDAGNIATTGALASGTLNVTGTTDLGAVGNLTITGGSNAQVLSTDGTGNLSWVDQGSGGGGITTGKSIAMAMIFGF